MSTRASGVLVAGARGFVGKALVPALARAGYQVRAGVRPAFDVDDDASVARAVAGVDVAVWLVHGLKRGPAYPAWELNVATRFARACAAAGVSRIVYLGGLDVGAHATKHLESRSATGRALREAFTASDHPAAGVDRGAGASGGGHRDVVELRAGMIVGAGSESWTIARDAAARLPVFLAPPWLHAKQQPVAVDDVIAALVAAVARDAGGFVVPGGSWDVPGPDVVTGAEIVGRTAVLLGRRPRFLPLPLFPRALAGRIAPWVTRADARVARELFLGMGIDFSVDGDGIFACMPAHRRLNFTEAAVRALGADDINGWANLYEAMVKRVA